MARLLRIRIGPEAVEGSTTRPLWVITTWPSATIRRAARRAGSMSSRQPSAETARAASEGQIVAPERRAPSSSVITCSSCRSSALTPRRRQASLQ